MRDSKLDKLSEAELQGLEKLLANEDPDNSLTVVHLNTIVDEILRGPRDRVGSLAANPQSSAEQIAARAYELFCVKGIVDSFEEAKAQAEREHRLKIGERYGTPQTDPPSRTFARRSRA